MSVHIIVVDIVLTYYSELHSNVDYLNQRILASGQRYFVYIELIVLKRVKAILYSWLHKLF